MERYGGRKKSSKAPRRSFTPEAHDDFSLLGQLKRLPVTVPEAAAELECPTKEKSAFMEALKKLSIKKMEVKKNGITVFREIPRKNPESPGAANSSSKFNFEHLEVIYKKLQADPLARSRLENLLAARAHKYGRTFWTKIRGAFVSGKNPDRHPGDLWYIRDLYLN